MSKAMFLRSDELADLATPADYVDVVRDAYRQVGEGAPAEPRTALYSAQPPGMLTTYIAVLPETGAMGGYTYAAGFGASDAFFVTPLYDAESGEPLAVLDGAAFNPFKTGAVGAVGLDALARTDASRLALFGTGRQARGQLLATATVRDWDRISVYSPTETHRRAFADEFDDPLDAEVVAVDTPETALEHVDAVVTATTASEPVFDGEHLPEGAHVTAIGQYHPERRELDAATVARSNYVLDLRARATQDAGAFIHALEAGLITEDHVHAELGEVIAGTAPGRTGDDELTVFDSGGTAIETVAAAYLLYERAVERGLGTPIEFAPASEAMAGGWD